MRQHDRATRAAALIALNASAESNGGTPAWHTVATELGLNRETLKNWWTQAQRKGAAAAARAPAAKLKDRSAAATPAPSRLAKSKRLADPLRASKSRYLRWQFEQLQADMELARDEGKANALPAMHQRLMEIERAYRAELEQEEKRKGTNLSPEEAYDRMRLAAEKMPTTHIELFLEVWRRRGVIE